VLFYQSCLSIVEVIDKKEQFPVISFSSKTFAKVFIEMLLNSVSEIVAAASIKSIQLPREKYVNGGHIKEEP